MLYWIEYRSDGTLTRFETDLFMEAWFALVGLVQEGKSELVGFGPELDGALDFVLQDVRLLDRETV